MEKFRKNTTDNQVLSVIGIILFWGVIIGVGWLIFGHHNNSSTTNANTGATSQSQALAPIIAACDRLPTDYITQVMSSTITDKQESNVTNGLGTQCWVQGTISNGPDWLLDYTVVPTANNNPTHIDKQSDNTGWWYEYESGRYKGTLIFTTKGTSPADDQIAKDMTNEIAKGLSNQ